MFDDIYDDLSVCIVCADRYVYNGDTCHVCQQQAAIDRGEGMEESENGPYPDELTWWEQAREAQFNEDYGDGCG